MKLFFKKVWNAICSHKIITAVVAVSVAAIIALFTCLGLFVFNRFSTGVVPTDAQIQALVDSGKAYDHVVVFGVDGAGGYFGQMDTPGHTVTHNLAAVVFYALGERQTPSWERSVPKHMFVGI